MAEILSIKEMRKEIQAEPDVVVQTVLVRAQHLDLQNQPALAEAARREAQSLRKMGPVQRPSNVE
jgi:hypothetical protein